MSDTETKVYANLRIHLGKDATASPETKEALMMIAVDAVMAAEAVAEGDEEPLRDRVQALKGTLEVKDEVDVLRGRVDEILAELSSRGVGVGLIGDERVRQIEEEGFTPEHDAEHRMGDLLDAARCYVTSAEATHYGPNNVTYDGGWRPGEGTPSDWPWDPSWWKPSGDPVRDLVKAGALIAAEIDRLTHE